ncbi:MAG TPA: HD domain-containing protein, partial [Solirubrobacteraceae bacterium]|nr:HD domain-containing protein [Solirubrobacteraceae bacterium]
EVLDRTIALQADPAAVLGDAELAEPVAALLVEPLADESTRGEALRWGALLHDAAKPLTRAVGPDGSRVTFVGHDERGAGLARALLGRLRTSERLRGHVAALVRHHLRLGLLVHAPQPPAKRVVFDYLQSTSPVEVDVTLLSVADLLAGASVGHSDSGTESVAGHMALARAMIREALRWRADGPPRPLWRGDELATALGIPEGPRLGAVLGELAAAQYAGEIGTREQALAHARAFLVA